MLVEPRVGCYEDAEHGDVPWVDATATYDEDSGDLTVLCVNRTVEEPLELRLDLRGFGSCQVVEATSLHDDDVQARNTEHDPDRIRPRVLQHEPMESGWLRAKLPPVSWTVIRLNSTRQE